MELIFRLEEPNSQYGAYKGSRWAASGDTNQIYSGNDEVHPGPHFADPMPFNHSHIFGFTSIADAKRWWFDVEDLRSWTTQGLRLVIWRQGQSEEILRGTRQCAFKRPSLKPLILPCEALHEIPLPIIERMVRDHFNVPQE